MHNLSDEALARAARHDPEAFAELYRRHVHRIYRYVLARVRTVPDAQDLTAQTFETLLGNIHTFRGEGAFAAWLTVIARNIVVNHYRSARRLTSLDALDEMADSLPSTDTLVSQQLQWERVLAALESLSPEQAEAVRLRIFGQLSTAETAEAMDRSEAAIKMLLHRALRTLRKQVGMDERDEVER